MPSDGLPTLTIHQPHSTLIMHRIKTILTRGWRAPERLIGQRIGIHASKRPPYLIEGTQFAEFAVRAGWPDLPLGALLGTVRLDACVPVVGYGDEVDLSRPYIAWLRDDLTGRLYMWDEDEAVEDLSQQAPFGRCEPGMWAWILGDPQPTTDRCPWCEVDGWPCPECDSDFNEISPPCDFCHHENCPVCDGAGSCPPIPAKGRQRVWTWRPER